MGVTLIFYSIFQEPMTRLFLLLFCFTTEGLATKTGSLAVAVFNTEWIAQNILSVLHFLQRSFWCHIN